MPTYDARPESGRLSTTEPGRLSVVRLDPPRTTPSDPVQQAAESKSTTDYCSLTSNLGCSFDIGFLASAHPARRECQPTKIRSLISEDSDHCHSYENTSRDFHGASPQERFSILPVTLGSKYEDMRLQRTVTKAFFGRRLGAMLTAYASCWEVKQNLETKTMSVDDMTIRLQHSFPYTRHNDTLLQY